MPTDPPAREPGPPSSVFRRGAVAAVALAIMATVAAATLPPEGFREVHLHSSVIVPLFPLLAALVAWHRRRTSDPTAAWAWIGAGVALFYLNDLLGYLAWRSPSARGVALAAQSLGLLFAPLALIGTLRGGAQIGSRAVRRRQPLDAIILALGLASIAFAIVALAGGGLRPPTGWRNVVFLLAPVIELITIGGLALLWIRNEGATMPAWAGSIAIALSIGLVSEIWYAMPASVAGSPPWFVHGAWYGVWAAIAVAAVQAMEPIPSLLNPGRISRLPNLITLACFVGLALAVALDLRSAIVPMTVSVGILTALVVLRDAIALRDITDMQAAQIRLEADTRLAALVRHGSDMLTIVDPAWRIRYASPSHQAVFGVAPELLVGRDLRDEMHPEDVADADAGVERLLKGSAREALVYRLRDPEGQWRWIEAVGTNLLGEPSVQGVVLNARDISEHKRLEVQLLEQALRDPLTGLANRRLFGDRVAHALARRHRRPDSVAVLLLDLDHFKVVNDSLGHAKGDALLIAVAERLRNVLRTADTVARLGGDEFAILLEDLEQAKEADAAAARIQQAFADPFLLDDREVVVRASIGIAWATDDQEVDDLLTDADVAMYGAKSSGRGKVERFSTAMRASVAERHNIEAELRRALDKDEFEVFYQPVVDLHSGRISGAEALVRWRHPTKGVILPARFIPIAEESELIFAIGGRVFRQAAFDVARFRTVRPESARMRIGVNLSARQLLSADLVDEVTAAARAAGVPGAALAVELTESVFASSEEAVASRLEALRALGLRIALDDFGTGYSALAYLRRFPIDVLKVDKSFVSWVRADGANDGVTKAIIAMGQSLSLRTIAEGIETDDQLAWLRSLGCHLGQGYLFSRPLPASDFVHLIRDWDPSPFAPPVREGAHR